MVSSRRASSEPIPEIMQPVQKFYDQAAQEISNAIDEELKTESIRWKEAKRKEVKVILLGQAESGKSTLQKQFQLYYASQSLESERPSWRPVVYFNVIKAVRTILDEVNYNVSQDPPSLEDEASYDSSLSAKFSQFRSKLLPLIATEQSLASELNGGVSISGGRAGIYVRPGWQIPNYPQQSSGSGTSSPNTAAITNLVARTLASVQDTIVEVWNNPTVQTLIWLRKIRLEETAAFFLDNIRRIAEPGYSPSTDDVLNVRLQTLGVIEHSFTVKLLGDTFNWRMYDVGGARGQRHAWVPFFDDGDYMVYLFSVAPKEFPITFTCLATAVIFLAPISAFDQYLEEDPHVNRIHDSLQLFESICSNTLLKNTHLVLLLNKTDLLKKKLQSGIEVRKYITSYGDRPNKYEHVSEYFRSHFVHAHMRKDHSRRTLFLHYTSMLDIKATQDIIADVGEAVIRSHLKQTGLL